MKMAFEVSQEVLSDQAFLLARSQVAPHSACPTACPARSLLDMLFLRRSHQSATVFAYWRPYSEASSVELRFIRIFRPLDGVDSTALKDIYYEF